jgi:hypothetical protein
MAKTKFRSRTLYWIAGFLAGTVVGTIVYFTWYPKAISLTTPAVIGAAIALWWGERKGKIRSLDEENRPISLFDDSQK